MRFNKFLILTAAYVIFIITVSQAAGAGQNNNKYFTLDNGLQIFLQERDRLPLVNIACGVDMGIKDEDLQSNGLVHLLEHLVLSGGTTSHKGDELIKEMREKGAYINAHTDHDMMTLEISLPANHLEYALHLVKEKIFELKSVEEELAREKKIICEEIDQIMDDPIQFGTSLALQRLFEGHAYGKPIFGDKKVITNAAIKELEIFYERFFTPGKCSLSIVGSFNLEETAVKIRTIFASVVEPAAPVTELSLPQPLKKNIAGEKKMDIDQAYAIIGLAAPPFNHEDYFPMDLLTYIIGKGFNPLIHLALGGRIKLAEGAFTRYIPLKYGGAFLVYVITEPGHIKTVERAVVKFLKTTRSFRYAKKDFLVKSQSSIFDYLESAKNQVGFNAEQAREEGLHEAISYAKYMLSAARDMNYKNTIETTASSQLRDVAAKYLSGKKYVVIYLLPWLNSSPFFAK